MFPIRALAAPILRTLGGAVVKKNSLTAEEDESVKCQMSPSEEIEQ